MFIGYAENSKAYRFLDLDSNVIVESRDAEFIENKFINDSTNTNLIQTQEDINDLGTNSSYKVVVTQSSTEPRKSQRIRKEKNLGLEFISSQAIVFLVEGNRNDVTNKIPILLNVEDDPKTFNKAIASRDATFWREAINDEMDSLLSNNI